MNKTPNYQLNQWEAEDRVLRTDFNADNAKLDAALGALAEMAASKADAGRVAALETAAAGILRPACGSYVGTGTNRHTIQIGFKPVFAMVVQLAGARAHTALVLGDRSIYSDECDHYSGGPLATEDGLSFFPSASPTDTNHADRALNESNLTYVWFALG